MARRETVLIKAGTAQADTGQTTQARIPRWARAVIFQLSVVAAAGTTPLTDYVLKTVQRKRTAAIAFSTTQAGGVGDNEVQTATLTGGPVGGKWGLTWGGVSADVSVSTGRVFTHDESAAEVARVLNNAIKAEGTYGAGTPVEVARTGVGTSGDPYVYAVTFSGTDVALTNVDALAALDGELFTDFTTALDYHGWNGITQIAGTTNGDVNVAIGPSYPNTTDDTGPDYHVQCELPDSLAHVLTFDRTTGNETYTYSLYATYIG
jgi:hypothetical protein